MANSATLYLTLPTELAHQLLQEELATPYLRTERADIELLPAVVLAVTTSAVTVVASETTKAALQAISARIRAWRNTHASTEPLIATVLDETGQRSTVEISNETTDDELASRLKRVSGEAASESP